MDYDMNSVALNWEGLDYKDIIIVNWNSIFKKHKEQQVESRTKYFQQVEFSKETLVIWKDMHSRDEWKMNNYKNASGEIVA